MSSDTSNRTLVLSVVAVDLVGYSRKSVAEQISLKDNFNHLLLQAISDISIADRIILDTGDGVAMGFLGDPEDALYVAMFMHDAINRDSVGGASAGLNGTGYGNAIRIGINLGPVKLATGVGGHPNIIGDGVNVAERIMSFAEPGQFTASRPFFEVMSRMSDHYATLFQYVGERTDKQVRTHAVYLVGKSTAAFRQARQGVAERAAQRAVPTTAPSIISPPPAPAAVSRTPAMPAPVAKDESYPALIDFLENRNKVATMAASLAVAAIVLAALLVYRKVPANSADGGTPAITAQVAAQNIAPQPKDSKAIPVPAVPVPSPSIVASPKIETKSPLPPSPPTSAPASVSPKPAAVPLSSAVPAASALPAKGSARLPQSLPASDMAKPHSVARDKPNDPKTEKIERAGQPEKPVVRDEPRKAMAPRTSEREKNAPVPNAPFVPSYQSPTAAPRPESVTPTPAPAPPPPVVASTEAIVVTRIAPPFPVEGVRQGIMSGFVKARLTIDARGIVSNVDILEAKPIAAFGREARTTLKDWKFNPGVPGRIYDVEITFRL